MTYMTATYSPEDNKLRLYASARLDEETYARVSAAGFKFAPKQDLFVAPMWTPSRADLLVELCGEIGDEETSLAERAEERADRFGDYQDKRLADAHRAREGVAAIADNIPLGQPILVGHHSERRARKDAERIENGMRRAVQMWDTAEYWQRRAAGALRNAMYKERPDVRHRRIKRLEADKRKSERSKQEAEMWLKLWLECEAEKDTELQKDVALRIAGMCWLRLPRKEGDREDFAHAPSAYDALNNTHPSLYAPRSLAEVIEHAKRVYPRQIAYAERWIAHYDLRIGYERAMLGEVGGLAAEQFNIEPGGRVLIGGEWLVVVRLNKRDGQAVSVTTNARYVRVRGIEEVKDYRAPSDEDAAKVAKAKKLPPLCNYPGEGFIELTAEQWKRKAADYKSTHVVEASEKHDAHRCRMAVVPGTGWKLAQVYITDQKRTDPPVPAAATEAAAHVTFARELAAPAPTAPRKAEANPEREQFQAMRDQLKTGVRVVSAPQLFPTPAPLARRMVELAELEEGQDVLEPSFGTQSLLRAIRTHGPACNVTGVEINRALALEQPIVCADRVICGDFLACDELGQFDRILMNPPFANAQDVAHITRALSLLKPGGRLVAICANGPRQAEALRPLVEAHGGEWESLPPETFSDSGTQVHTALITLTV
ncbi:TPA: DUF3560 domain-containing protein [Pseudomonas aeruginosa]|nr:DUF3560 domain-containing protein [Pseudomonas aeruginosa]